MKEITEAGSIGTVVLMSGKGNYALVAGKGTGARLRVAPESTRLSADSAAALLETLS